MDKYDYDEIKKIICTMYPLATYVDKMFDEIKLDKDLKDGDYITIYDSFTILIFNKKTASNRGWFYTTYGEPIMTQIERWEVDCVEHK
jgi:hypothetical protein